MVLADVHWVRCHGPMGLSEPDQNEDNSRQPTKILYVLYSSRSCGASLFLGSCGIYCQYISDTFLGLRERTNLMAICWLFNRFVPSNSTPKEPSPIFLPTL